MISPHAKRSLYFAGDLEVQKSNFYHRLKENLRAYVLVVCSVVFAIFACVLASLVICELLPFWATAGIVISILIAGVLAVLAIRSYLSPCMIPWGFLDVINAVYPKVIYSLCISENLGIQELRKVLQDIETGEFSNASNFLKEKIESFGVEKLLKGCEDATLPPLDTVLQTHCPAYFLKAFLSKATPKDPEEDDVLTQITHWFGYSVPGKKSAIFDEHSWLFASVVSQEEYENLIHYAEENTWPQAEDLLTSIETRILKKASDQDVPDLDYRDLLPCRCLLNEKIPLICNYRMHWEQLQMIKEIGALKLYFLDRLNTLPIYGKNLLRIMNTLYPIIDEESADYDSHIALMNWEEWKNGVNFWSRKKSMDGAAALMEEMTQRSITKKVLKPLTLEEARSLV
ncbi:phage holin family protein [Chlamydia vaughanii]|uniref:phage holin family protein n=1 Tax=Chlamydia vaughanii TaxID=3112552 RepID=UPI0032B0F9F6